MIHSIMSNFTTVYFFVIKQLIMLTILDNIVGIGEHFFLTISVKLCWVFLIKKMFSQMTGHQGKDCFSVEKKWPIIWQLEAEQVHFPAQVSRIISLKRLV